MHFLGECLIEFASPTIAVVETYFMTAHTLGPEAQHQYGAASNGGPVQLSHYGRYADRVEKRDDVWRIAHRASHRGFRGDALNAGRSAAHRADLGGPSAR